MNDITREALRYLGAGEGDMQTLSLVEECLEALSVAVPRHVMQTAPAAEIVAAFPSRALAAHLVGCDTAVLFAATLGTKADQMIRRAESVDMLRGTALHACAAAKIEAYCDQVQASVPGAERPRFSPGYGDFSLALQKPLLERLDAGRRIGLYLMDSGMLVPAKSVTAVLPIGSAAGGCAQNKCIRCTKGDCAFRMTPQATQGEGERRP